MSRIVINIYNKPHFFGKLFKNQLATFHHSIGANIFPFCFTTRYEQRLILTPRFSTEAPRSKETLT